MMEFKFIFICSALIGFTAEVAAQEVPVTDMGTKSAISSMSSQAQSNHKTLNDTVGKSGQATVSSIGALGKQFGNLIDVLDLDLQNQLKAMADLEAKRRNAELYNTALGVKPRTSCGILQGASARKAGEASVKSVKLALTGAAKLHNQRSTYDELGEAGPGVDSDRIFRQTKRAAEKAQKANEEDISAGNPPSNRMDIFSDASLTAQGGVEAENTELLSKLLNVAVPFPVKMQEGYDDPGQSDLVKFENAKKLVHIERQNVVAEMISKYVTSRSAVYDKSFAAGLGMNDVADVDVTSGIDGNVGQMEMESLLNTHRVKSDKWMAWVNTTNEVGALRDIAVVSAQSLSALDQMNKHLAYQNVILSLMYAQSIESDGLPTATLNE